jgi:predicted nicotinamide N-methyase
MSNIQSSSSSSGANKPRNFLVTDATKPYIFTFLQYGRPVSITVRQTAAEETWPGGSLWDIGVILANVLVCLAGFQPSTTTATGKVMTIQPPLRLVQAIPSVKDLTVLELGCGVGLTGIVAAAVLGTQLTVLTDLDVVVNKVARPNMEENSTEAVSTNKQMPYRLTKAGKRGRIMALPLCWGNEQDENTVMEYFLKYSKEEKSKRKSKKGPAPPKDLRQPDLIIIGDVAYQHKPGAPSHYDVLLSTLLKFLGPHTLVIFGTRMRMPASSDLLDMFHEHMEEVADPPIRADEIDPAFAKFKHQTTIHVLRKRMNGRQEMDLN